MQQTPWSARTSAPASVIKSPLSLVYEKVRPADVLPIPLVKTARLDSFVAYFKSCDFPVPGSPTINK